MDRCRIPHSGYLRIRRGGACDEDSTDSTDSASTTSSSASQLSARSAGDSSPAPLVWRALVSTWHCLYWTLVSWCVALFVCAVTLFVSWWFLAVE